MLPLLLMFLLSDGWKNLSTTASVQHLNAAQRSLSNELVITGLPITDTTSPKAAVYAALKLLDVELLERDILHVRKIRRKPSAELQNHTTSVTDAEELQNGNAE